MNIPRMVEVNGRRLALRCSGSGTLLVILETGLGAESSEWAEVERGVGQFARVCSYDRLGRGRSDPVTHPRSAEDMIEDLRALLRAADLSGPFLVAGHSFGGLLARLFAQRYRDEVRGLILVDALHQDQFDVFGPLLPPPRPDEPPALRSMREFWQGGWRRPESTVERIDMVESISQARGIRSLGALPLHLLTAGTCLNDPHIPPAHRQHMQDRWDALQGSFLQLSSAAMQSFVKHSGHFIQRDDPQAIVDGIWAMVRCQSRT